MKNNIQTGKPGKKFPFRHMYRFLALFIYISFGTSALFSQAGPDLPLIDISGGSDRHVIIAAGTVYLLYEGGENRLYDEINIAVLTSNG